MGLRGQLFERQLRFVHAIAQRVKRGVRQARPAIFKALIAASAARRAVSAAKACTIRACVAARIWARVRAAISKAGLFVAKLAIAAVTAPFVAKAACFWLGGSAEFGTGAVIASTRHNRLRRSFGRLGRRGGGFCGRIALHITILIRYSFSSSLRRF